MHGFMEPFAHANGLAHDGIMGFRRLLTVNDVDFARDALLLGFGELAAPLFLVFGGLFRHDRAFCPLTAAQTAGQERKSGLAAAFYRLSPCLSPRSRRFRGPGRQDPSQAPE